MDLHTFPVDRADALEEPERYRYCSAEELVSALRVGPDGRVADLGSGTGFYTDDVAPFVDTVYAVDVQPAMHDRYREKGIPDNVVTVAAAVASLPFATDALDGAFSVATHHEYAEPAAVAELARVIRPGGLLVTVDWSADGRGEDGPPLEERFGLGESIARMEEAGFAVESARSRTETFVLVVER